MAEVQQPASMPAPVITSYQNRTNLEAVAGPNLEVAAASGKISSTDTPKFGEPEAFFPANPAIANELAQNKPVKALTSAERTSSGGLMRTISDVITELVQKHQNKKRDRVQEAASGSPSQAKFRKGLEMASDSSSQAKGSPLKSGTSVGTPKRAGSGFGDKVPRMTCWGTSDQPVVVKKPSLAERYSAWKVKQQERRAARIAKSPALPPAKKAETVIVSDKAIPSEAAQVSKEETAEAAEITMTSLPLEG